MTQEALQIPGGYKWTEGDPVSWVFYVDTDWSGSYVAEIRKARTATATKYTEFTITAEYNVDVDFPNETKFTLTLTEAESALVPKGQCFTDIQQVNGVTRLWACLDVGPQVSVP